MKQKGQVWFDNKGLPTASKHVPNYDRICETLGQRLAAAAEDIETRIIESKQKAREIAEQIFKLYSTSSGAKETKMFTFYVYDKSFRFEVDKLTSENLNMRVYRATKENPTHRDYELLHMDWSKPLKNDKQIIIPGERNDRLDMELTVGELVPAAPAAPAPEEPLPIESGPDIVRED